jgi:hypothetical protein
MPRQKKIPDNIAQGDWDEDALPGGKPEGRQQ